MAILAMRACKRSSRISTDSVIKINWQAVTWGLFYFLGMVIILKLVEGLVFSTLPYDSRGVGRFLSADEYRVQGYSPMMLLGYMVVHAVKIAVPSYLTAQIAGSRCVLHAAVVVAIATLIGWLLFQAVLRAPVSELIGLGFSLSIAGLAAKAYEHRLSSTA